MTRTARRPIPRGRISRVEALAFGLGLACCAVTVLALALNIKAAALLAFAIFCYVVVYTTWLDGGLRTTSSSVASRAPFLP